MTFNRTIVELKPYYNESREEGNHTFNRTIVELKPDHNESRAAGNQLLIEPLWN